MSTAQTATVSEIEKALWEKNQADRVAKLIRKALSVSKGETKGTGRKVKR